MMYFEVIYETNIINTFVHKYFEQFAVIKILVFRYPHPR